MATAEVLNHEVGHHLTRKPLPAPDATPEPVALTPADLLKIAVTQNADIDKLEKLMQLWREYKRDAAREAFVAAMNAFKKNPPAILKNTTASMAIKQEKGGGSYSYSYATLDQVCRAVVQGLSEVGISHRWTMKQNGVIQVTCVLTHELGHAEETSLEGAADLSGGKNSIQAVGSTVTYLQRYTLLAACGLAASGTDTDGKVIQAAQGLSADRVKEMVSELRRASNIDQLRKIFEFAYPEARKANDRAAQEAYIDAKDQRRKELQLR